MVEPSATLMEFALFALDHAADSVIDAGSPLVPFAVVEVGDERKLSRYLGDLEDGQREARHTVRTTPHTTRAAVAWDGYLTVQGVRTDAVFVEAFEYGASDSVIVAQRYEKTGRARKTVQRDGNAAIVGAGAPLF